MPPLALPPPPVDPARVDVLLQFILAAAGQEDEPRDRELGPIHLLKYTYLADLAHAERHAGETFTRALWRFHHFGPWEPQVLDRIEPALSAAGAEKKTVPSAKYEDFVRYSLHDERLLDRLQTKLPGEVLSAVRWSVHEFGSDTASLLRHVYTTPPMLRAAPGETLSFVEDEEQRATRDELSAQEHAAKWWRLTESHVAYVDQAEVSERPGLVRESSRARRKAKKTREERLAALKQNIRQRLDQAKKERVAASAPPRYDEVFFEGVEWLDSLEGEPIEPLHGEATFSDDVWKSPSRRGSDVS